MKAGIRTCGVISWAAAVAICTQAPAAEKGATSAAPRSDHAAEVHGLARAPFVIPLRSGVADASNALPAQELMFGEPPVKLARNVVNPTLTAFLPETSHATGTAVIVAPGGAFIILAVAHEGDDVARWLAERGVAAFTLRYRLAPTPRDDAEFRTLRAQQMRKPKLLQPIVKSQAPISIEDGKEAVRLVRMRAAEWGIAPHRVGILGFSAGGAVAVGAATGYGRGNRPAFAASIYGAGADVTVPSDAPPVFIAAAADDPVVPANTSVQLYSHWVTAGRPAELHIYVKGGHGFGLHEQRLPSDHWIDAFYAWLIAERFARQR